MLESTRSNTGHKYIHFAKTPKQYQVKLTANTTRSFSSLENALKFRNRTLTKFFGKGIDYILRSSKVTSPISGIVGLYGYEVVYKNRVNDVWEATSKIGTRKRFLCNDFASPEAAFFSAVAYLCKQHKQLIVTNVRNLFVSIRQLEEFLKYHDLPEPLYLCSH